MTVGTVRGGVQILKGGSSPKSKNTSLNFRRADFDNFRHMLGRVPWDMALEGRGAQES